MHFAVLGIIKRQLIFVHINVIDCGPLKTRIDFFFKKLAKEFFFFLYKCMGQIYFN